MAGTVRAERLTRGRAGRVNEDEIGLGERLHPSSHTSPIRTPESLSHVTII